MKYDFFAEAKKFLSALSTGIYKQETRSKQTEEFPMYLLKR